MKILKEEQYPFTNFSPLKNIFEAYQIIIGRLHIIDQENFQTLFEHGIEELYQHLSFMYNASSNILQREYHSDFHYYLQSSIHDALERCIPIFENTIAGKADKLTVLN